MSVGARVAKLMMAPYGILWGVCRWRHYASSIAGDAFSGPPLQTAGSGHPIVHLEKTFQRDIDLVVISKEAGDGLPRATQKIPAKLYIDVWPVLDDDIGIVIITRSRDINTYANYEKLKEGSMA